MFDYLFDTLKNKIIYSSNEGNFAFDYNNKYFAYSDDNSYSIKLINLDNGKVYKTFFGNGDCENFGFYPKGNLTRLFPLKHIMINIILLAFLIKLKNKGKFI